MGGDFIHELYPDENPEDVVDVVVGGPPCQAFARVGRAKLREVYDHPEAFKLDPRALAIFEERLRELRRTENIPEGSERYKQLMAEIVPPYDPGKFPNKWRKMEPDQPARTLMAHLGKDSYSHIHYDSDQARTISVREAARLQSFPDGFRFAGAMNAAFRQIGNAVPPLLAKHIAAHIRSLLDLAISRRSLTAASV